MVLPIRLVEPCCRRMLRVRSSRRAPGSRWVAAYLKTGRGNVRCDAGTASSSDVHISTNLLSDGLGAFVIIVSFQTKKLRVLCEDPQVAVTQLGDDVARLLRARLADLRSADGLFDLPTGNPRVEDEHYLLDLGKTTTMRWVPSGRSANPTDTSALDWTGVSTESNSWG